MARVDTLAAYVNQALQKASQSGCIVKTSSEWYLFFIANENTLYWSASYNDGFSWSAPVLIKSLTNGAFAIWYERWTPGNTGDLVHLAYFEGTNDDVYYRSFDTASENLGTEVVIFAGATTGALATTCISITCAIGGNLYCAFDIDGGTETGFYRSTDAGASWAARTDVNEATSDYYRLVPGFAADTQDIMAIYWDRSADEISRKIYDDSANSWAESSIAGSMVDISNATCSPQFDVAVDDANNKILLVAWSNRDTANADLRFWTIDESSITEGTNVVLNSGDDQQMCSIGLATDTTTIYVFYGGKSDGSETAGGVLNIYYKTSTDAGATWGSETLLSSTGFIFEYLFAPMIFTGTPGAVYVYNAPAGIDIMVFSAEFPAGGGGVATPMFGGGIIQ